MPKRNGENSEFRNDAIANAMKEAEERGLLKSKKRARKPKAGSQRQKPSEDKRGQDSIEGAVIEALRESVEQTDNLSSKDNQSTAGSTKPQNHPEHRGTTNKDRQTKTPEQQRPLSLKEKLVLEIRALDSSQKPRELYGKPVGDLIKFRDQQRSSLHQQAETFGFNAEEVNSIMDAARPLDRIKELRALRDSAQEKNSIKTVSDSQLSDGESAQQQGADSNLRAGSGSKVRPPRYNQFKYVDEASIANLDPIEQQQIKEQLGPKKFKKRGRPDMVSRPADASGLDQYEQNKYRDRLAHEAEQKSTESSESPKSDAEPESPETADQSEGLRLHLAEEYPRISAESEAEPAPGDDDGAFGKQLEADPDYVSALNQSQGSEREIPVYALALLSPTGLTRPEREDDVIDGEIIEAKHELSESEPFAELRGRLTLAEQKYSKQYTAVGQLKRGFFVKTKAYRAAEQELSAARQEYSQAVAEAAKNDIRIFFDENAKLEDQRFAQFEREKGRVEKIYEKYRSMSRGKRAAINLALLGGSLVAPIGGGLFLMGRRALSGAAAGGASYDMLRLMHDRKLEKQSQQGVMSTEQLSQTIAAMQSRTLLDGGKISDLNSNAEYRDLVEHYNASIREKLESSLGPSMVERLQQQIQEEGQTRTGQLVNEQRWRNSRKVLAAAIGTFVGTGAAYRSLGTAYEHLFGAADPELPPTPHADINLPEPLEPPLEPGHAPSSELSRNLGQAEAAAQLGTEPSAIAQPEKIELLHNNQSTGAAVELYPEQAVVHAGTRGLEGALLDLKIADPERYASMTEWLREKYGSGNDGALVHKFFLDSDGTDGKNLDRIFSGQVSVLDSGEIKFDVASVKFMPPADSLDVPSVTEPVESASPEPGLVGDSSQAPESGEPDADSRITGAEPTPDIGTEPVAETSESEDADFDPAEQTRAVQEARETAAFSVDKTSHALQLVLGDEYKGFLKNQLGNISAKDLNKLKHVTYWQLTEYPEQSERFARTYGRVAEYLKDRGLKPADNVHQALIKQAIKWRNH